MRGERGRNGLREGFAQCCVSSRVCDLCSMVDEDFRVESDSARLAGPSCKSSASFSDLHGEVK